MAENHRRKLLLYGREDTLIRRQLCLWAGCDRVQSSARDPDWRQPSVKERHVAFFNMGTSVSFVTALVFSCDSILRRNTFYCGFV